MTEPDRGIVDAIEDAIVSRPPPRGLLDPPERVGDRVLRALLDGGYVVLTENLEQVGIGREQAVRFADASGWELTDLFEPSPSFDGLKFEHIYRIASESPKEPR